MPLVKRLETNILRFVRFTDFIVNPCNLVGAMGAGIALALKEQFPDIHEDYKMRLNEGSFSLENPIYAYKPNNSRFNFSVINLVTKRHWMDTSRLDDVEVSIEHLAKFLKQYPKHTVVLPMLGGGNGGLNYDQVEPLMYKYLHTKELNNVIHLCYHPDKIDAHWKYFGLVGSRYFTDADEYLPIMMTHIEKALDEWGIPKKATVYDTVKSYFENAVSGGAKGTDEIMCGRSYLEGSFKNTNSGNIQPSFAKLCGFDPIICDADWDRDPKLAGFIRNRTVVDIATHMVAFRSTKVDNNGTNDTINTVHKWNEHYPNNPIKLKVIDI